ncbi:unnamed protein product, partial [Ixodes pacificus]
MPVCPLPPYRCAFEMEYTRAMILKGLLVNAHEERMDKNLRTSAHLVSLFTIIVLMFLNFSSKVTLIFISCHTWKISSDELAPRLNGFETSSNANTCSLLTSCLTPKISRTSILRVTSSVQCRRRQRQVKRERTSTKKAKWERRAGRMKGKRKS